MVDSGPSFPIQSESREEHIALLNTTINSYNLEDEYKELKNLWKELQGALDEKKRTTVRREDKIEQPWRPGDTGPGNYTLGINAEGERNAEELFDDKLADSIVHHPFPFEGHEDVAKEIRNGLHGKIMYQTRILREWIRNVQEMEDHEKGK